MSSWTSKDINNLKQYFVEGLSLKEMSLLLGRTVTAINKALTRFKIRQHRPLAARTLKKQDLILPKKMLIEWRRTMECDMDEVHEFVKKRMAGRLKFKDNQWFYHGSVITQRRAFILINIERSFRKFPAFYLDYDKA